MIEPTTELCISGLSSRLVYLGLRSLQMDAIEQVAHNDDEV